MSSRAIDYQTLVFFQLRRWQARQIAIVDLLRGLIDAQVAHARAAEDGLDIKPGKSGTAACGIDTPLWPFSPAGSRLGSAHLQQFCNDPGRVGLVARARARKRPGYQWLQRTGSLGDGPIACRSRCR